DGLNTAVKKIRDLLGDSAEHPRYIETVPKRGYRFVGQAVLAFPAHPVEPPIVSAPELVPVGVPVVPVSQSPATSRLRFVALTVLSTGLIFAVPVAASRWRALPFVRSQMQHIESLAVLPLTNLSHDPEQDYFADGMTESLITDLAQVRALRIISRTSV